MKQLTLLLSSLLAIFLITTASAESARNTSDDAKDIRNTINGIYDTAEHKVVIDPIVVRGAHAVASWTQQDKGGRVVLFRSAEGKWNIVLCSGKAVKDAVFLQEAGIPQADAHYLATELSAAEAKVGKEKIALFDSFNGVMRTSNHHEQKNPHDPPKPTPASPDSYDDSLHL